MKIHIHEVAMFETESLSDVELVGLEEVTVPEAEKVLRKIYQALRPNGLLEFAALDWNWCIKHSNFFGPDLKLSNVLFDVPRRSVWDERTIVKTLLKVGFHRLWTGRVPEYPEHMIYVKARKFGPEGKEKS